MISAHAWFGGGADLSEFAHEREQNGIHHVVAHQLENYVHPETLRARNQLQSCAGMDSVIESQRRLLEERERVEDALVKEKMLKKHNVREWASTRVDGQHRRTMLMTM